MLLSKFLGGNGGTFNTYRENRKKIVDFKQTYSSVAQLSWVRSPRRQDNIHFVLFFFFCNCFKHFASISLYIILSPSNRILRIIKLVTIYSWRRPLGYAKLTNKKIEGFFGYIANLFLHEINMNNVNLSQVTHAILFLDQFPRIYDYVPLIGRYIVYQKFQLLKFFAVVTENLNYSFVSHVEW